MTFSALTSLRLLLLLPGQVRSGHRSKILTQFHLWHVPSHQL